MIVFVVVSMILWSKAQILTRIRGPTSETPASFVGATFFAFTVVDVVIEKNEGGLKEAF
jgi:hypothetical protein